MIEANPSLLNNESFLDFLFNNLNVAIFVVDENLRIKIVNDPFKELFLTNDAEVLNELCGNALGCEFAARGNEPCGTTPECAGCELREALRQGIDGQGKAITTYLSKDFVIGEKKIHKFFEITSKGGIFEGNPIVIVAMLDVTELEEQRLKILEMANRDFLTGLANRRYFFEIGENLFQNAKRGNIAISVAMFDIDHFKRINDTLGHAAGDYVIREISGVFSANLRKSDVISRFGGEEFCVLLHCKDAGDAYAVVDKLRLLIELHVFVFAGKKIDVTISAGLTSVIGDNLAAMVETSDKMLYKAKANGRNRTEEFSA